MIFCPVPLLDRSCTNVERSSNFGITFSIPITTTCTGGTLVTSRALPSLVTVQIVPVSATPKLAPVMPMSAFKNFSLRRFRAKAARDSTSGGRSSSETPERISVIRSLFMCRIGPTMCEGVSPASCAIHSPRSVSTISSPRSA